MKLTEEVKDLNTKNCKTFFKEIEENTNKCKDIYGLEELLVLKCP